MQETRITPTGAREREGVPPVKTDFKPVAEGTTRKLAQFIVGTRFEDLPADVVRGTGRMMVDCVGVSLGAVGDPSLRMLLDTIEVGAGAPQATAWTTGKRVSAADAALFNGHLSHVLDFDDTYFSDQCSFHVNAPVVPAAFALAEWKRASGAEFVRAMTLGSEIMFRVGLSAGLKHHRQRWLVTTTAGAYGAVAAAGALLRLDENQMVQAFGIAGSQSGGLNEIVGGMTKGLNAGRASASGVFSALLAQRGFTSAEDILTGKFGFHAVFHSDQNMDALVGEIGTRWDVRKASLKAFACGTNLQALLMGILNLRERHTLKAADLAEIEITCNPHVLGPTGIKEPKTGLQGKFSVYHASAAAYLDGAVGTAQFTDQRVHDPAVIEARGKVKIVPSDAVRRDEAFVAIRLRDGRTLAEHVLNAPGTPEAPLTDAQLAAKFSALARDVLPGEQIDPLIDTLMHLERERDLSSVVSLIGRDMRAAGRASA